MEVVTKDKSILITELQMPGKKKVNIKDFVNGIKKEDYIGKIFVQSFLCKEICKKLQVLIYNVELKLSFMILSKYVVERILL